MIVYIYDKQTNEKKQTIQNVVSITSLKDKFLIDVPWEHKYIDKDNIKLVVYGF